ncbi:hypothetical protein [Neorhizobium alkalisoli]|uniref:hypothetical protein n=1 Tax=Neorhizobium alkalisoli TaxID=528178 RepID=UPI000CF9875B|nr:hypothetical protein [Neorhizobium alkalisoli]
MKNRRAFLKFAGAGFLAMNVKDSTAAPTVRGAGLNQGSRLWHVDAFGVGKSRVGSGSDDTVALQSAMSSGEMIDVTGALLRVSDTINVDYSGANISSVMASRVGDRASSKITVVDDEMPLLFNICGSNFEASGFFCECGGGNKATTLFHFERPAGSAVDIDADLEGIGHEGGARFFYHSGRGLKLRNITSGNVKVSFGDLDFPVSWVESGQSNDTPVTAMRAYQFHEIRMHGAAAGIRNIGANALNCGPILASDWLSDIGGGPLFIGVSPGGSKFSNLISSIGATLAGGLLDLHAGSRQTTFANISAVGIKKGADLRLNRNAIMIRPTAANPIYDIVFNGGSIGPCNRNGIYILGDGACYITCVGVGFDRTNIEGAIYSPIRVEESGGTLSDVWVKFSACNFRFGGETAPAYLVGGLDSANVHIRRDYTTTKPSVLPWAQASVDDDGP